MGPSTLRDPPSLNPRFPVTGAGRGPSGSSGDQEVRTCSVSIYLGFPSGDRHCLPSLPQAPRLGGGVYVIPAGKMALEDLPYGYLCSLGVEVHIYFL